ncbi:ras-associating and dilute domain-containing protein isoform X2 [Brachyhypopomus gauderio]|uniref:ras-associating and dilute domain-containing protein isoform X2 n=1 Tax=Brachyhypopomus gauderio TaxID=698409 RepID=UPI004043379E
MISSERILPTPPVGVPLCAPNRRLSKVGRKQSNGSVQSSSSSSTARSMEGVGLRQPAKNRIRRHQHRLSSVFRRGMLGDRGETAGAETPAADDPSELSNHITAPGILKIFGNEICEGANYKSVLATTHSSAKELVKEALERYSLSKAQADAYVLCDVIGRIGEQEWRAECLRVIGDNEKPLLLQALWKPREGYARRFEIQRRTSVEEQNSKDKDTVTAGINAQARRLQKTRSRGRSVVLDGGGTDDVPGDGPALRRSLSEADLEPESLIQPGPSPEPHENLTSQSLRWGGGAHETLCSPDSEREETESSADNSTEYSIHPPQNVPYFLLLQGFSQTQDFIIYPLSGICMDFGSGAEPSEREKEQPAVGVALWAPDIQPQHCIVRRLEPAATSGHGCELGKDPGFTVLTPLNGAVVKKNGAVINQEVKLQSGDIIGLGDHYLFMFKDPTEDAGHACALTLPWLGELFRVCSSTPPPLCKTCILSKDPVIQTPVKALLCLRDADGKQLALSYDEGHEVQILKEIFTRVDHHDETHKLAPSFLLSLCLQQSATHFPMTDLRRLLLQITSEVQMAILERAKELATLQSEIEGGAEPVGLHPLSTKKLLRGLKPLVLWMANSLELLHFIHQEVPRLLHGISQEEEEEEEDCMAVLELRLSTIRPASEEAMTVLEEVIMFAFQQCVYYLTKLLYRVLPSLLNSNPFTENGQLQIPDDVGSVLDIFTKTMNLVKDFHVHPEISLQLFTYLLFFANAFLFNLLMERGSGGSFYSWSCGVQIRANLDLLMDWAYAAGLGELAQNYLLKLSSAVNLLATPREHLLQASWSSLRAEFAPLRPAQLHHMLREYDPRRACPSTWTPSSDETEAALRTADILESFDDHPPLILPMDGFLLDLKKPLGESSLIKQLSQLQMTIDHLESNTHTTQSPQSGSAVPLKARRTKMKIPPKAHLEQKHTEVVLPRDTVPSCSVGSGLLDSCEALLAQKMKALELRCEKPNTAQESSCLLTPPNTPQSSDPVEPELERHDPHPRDKAQCSDSVTRGEGGCEKHEIGDDEVFVVELQRSPGGLGLALVNGLETTLNMSGIFIKSVIPGSPAALSQRLRPGDRILAVNGLGLSGVDYHTLEVVFYF